jgi:hypothetical protein
MPAEVARFIEINDKKYDAPFAQKLLTKTNDGTSCGQHLTINGFSPSG